MKKRFTKIICIGLSVIAVAASASLAGCSNYYSASALPGEGTFTDDKAVSNGGFAVGKGDYIYFINGVETNTADNGYGAPVKGAIYRISKNNLKNRDYNKADKVVPLVAYTADYNAGIFVYGDYIYYGTPSTARNSAGVVQNSVLEMKRSKLDGTETMKNCYVQFPSTSYEYRYVEEGGTVYLMYIATDETLYDETSGVTNLHSYNTSTGVDTLLAYDVDKVIFDADDKTNPRVYYTMDVYDHSATAEFGYNQLYTVTASATEDKFENKLSSETILGWDDEDDRYINCGDLVLDGVGSIVSHKTPFNKEEEVNLLNYTYTLKTYTHDNLFFTRKAETGDYEGLFALKEDAYLTDNSVSESWNTVTGNPAEDKKLLVDGTSTSEFKYLFNSSNELEGAIVTETTGVSVNKCVDGALQSADELGIGDNYFKIIKDGSVTVLWVDGDNKQLYYSVTGGTGYTVNRIKYDGTVSDYEPLPNGDTDETPVKILDLDVSSSWYKPEIIDGYLLFASETKNMSSYNYVMVFDMHGENGLLTNAEIRALNKLYEGVNELINETYDDTDKYPAKDYANLKNALNYAFYQGDYEYLKELAEASNATVEEGGNLIYSEATLAEYEAFLKPESGNLWADYEAKRTVNGNTVYANMHDYYYAVLGEMTEADTEAYMDGLKSSYLVSWPEEDDTGWYDSLTDGEKAGFIIGMCLLGLAVIAGATVLAVWFIKRNKKTAPETRRRKVKLDTAEDKDIDVYSTED